MFTAKLLLVSKFGKCLDSQNEEVLFNLFCLFFKTGLLRTFKMLIYGKSLSKGYICIIPQTHLPLNPLFAEYLLHFLRNRVWETLFLVLCISSLVFNFEKENEM